MNVIAGLDWTEIAAILALIFVSYLGLPLMLSLGFPLTFAIGGFTYIREKLEYSNEYSDWEEWLIFMCIPFMLLAFVLGCALNLILVPIGLLFGPPVFLIAVGYKEW